MGNVFLNVMDECGDSNKGWTLFSCPCELVDVVMRDVSYSMVARD